MRCLFLGGRTRLVMIRAPPDRRNDARMTCIHIYSICKTRYPPPCLVAVMQGAKKVAINYASSRRKGIL